MDGGKNSPGSLLSRDERHWMGPYIFGGKQVHQLILRHVMVQIFVNLNLTRQAGVYRGARKLACGPLRSTVVWPQLGKPYTKSQTNTTRQSTMQRAPQWREQCRQVLRALPPPPAPVPPRMSGVASKTCHDETAHHLELIAKHLVPALFPTRVRATPNRPRRRQRRCRLAHALHSTHQHSETCRGRLLASGQPVRRECYAALDKDSARQKLLANLGQSHSQ